MYLGIFYEIQVNSPLKHREREAEVFHQVLDQVVEAEEAGFNNFWSVEHHFQRDSRILRRPRCSTARSASGPQGSVSATRWCCCRFPTTTPCASPSGSRRSTS